MDKTTAQRLVRETFKAAFDKKRYRDFINELCNGFDEGKAQNMSVPVAFTPHVKSCQRLGTFESADGELADVLIVQLTESYKLERTRTALRDFVAHKLKRDESYKEAGLVAFVAPDSQSWRFSFVRMEYETKRDPKTGKIKPEERLTPARRYSYIVGVDEECHTAQSRFLALLQDTTGKPTLSQIEEAFSVESVTKEFFAQYAALFASAQKAMDTIVKKDVGLKSEFTLKGVCTVDFTKKLLGQIVFLYFIQKKGWLGVRKGGNWGDGPRNFLRQLADQAIRQRKCFFNDVLEPLFYDTLATNRTKINDLWANDAWVEGECRIPFLNGGLFEPLAGYDWKDTNISLPNSLFTNSDRSPSGDIGSGILDVFDRYNFTVNEAEPLEKEVAIDPEMLGKVFENLIEENRRKGLGAYYTPREIVHYMCQESLINYLDTALNKNATVVPREDIAAFIREGEQAAHYEAARKDGTTSYAARLPAVIEKQARALDDALKAITVCDPAIGSGAFPVGMMTEIVRARLALNPYIGNLAQRTTYLLKRHAIQNSIYGADVDSGAVEIAKLRLWLSLVVDEDDVDQIKPLPNLDYKVVTGDSLMGIERDLTMQPVFARLEQLKPLYFDETDARQKKNYKREMDKLIASLTRNKQVFDFHVFFSEVFHVKKGFDVVIANPPYIGESGNKELFRKTKEGPLGEFYLGKMDYFYFFFHLALNLAGPNGQIAFITTNYYLTAAGARKLRADFKRRALMRTLVNFNELRIFESALGQHNLVTILRKGAGNEAVQTCVTSRKGQGNPQVLSCILRWNDDSSRYYSVSQKELYDGGENYIRLNRESITSGSNSPTINSVLDKVARQGEALGKIANINQGVVSGCDYVSKRNSDKLPRSGDWQLGDGIFVLNLENARDQQVFASLPKAERSLLRDFFKNTDIKRFWCAKDASKKIIYYPAELNQTRFPHIYEHLLRFKGILKARLEQYNERYHWTAHHRSRSEEIFTGPKIVIPYRSEENAFAYNDAEWFCRSDCYVITQKYPNYSLAYLLALLNSRLYYQWLFHRGKRKGKMLEMMQIPLSEIPIKPLDAAGQKEFITLTDRILAAKREDPAADTSKLEAVIETKVFDLYDLTEDEREIVMAPAS